MSELSPVARRLVEATRAQLGPSAADLARVRRNLRQKVPGALDQERWRTRARTAASISVLVLLAMWAWWLSSSAPSPRLGGVDSRLEVGEPYRLTKVRYLDPRPSPEPRVKRSFAPPPPVEPVREERASPPPSEWALIQAAHRALEELRWGEALQAGEEHRLLFPESALVEERLAIEILALCPLGRSVESEQKQRELRSRAPRSAYWERIHQDCSQP